MKTVLDKEHGVLFSHDDGLVCEYVSHKESRSEEMCNHFILNVTLHDKKTAIIAKQLLYKFFCGIHECFTIEKTPCGNYKIVLHSEQKLETKSKRTQFKRYIETIEMFLYGIKYTNIIIDRVNEIEGVNFP